MRVARARSKIKPELYVRGLTGMTPTQQATPRIVTISHKNTSSLWCALLRIRYPHLCCPGSSELHYSPSPPSARHHVINYSVAILPSHIIRRLIGAAPSTTRRPFGKMAWTCSGSTNAELIGNLWHAGLIKDERVRDAMLKVRKYIP